MLLVGALVLLVAVAAVRLSVRSGLPSLLLYLAIGMALGVDGPGRIDFNFPDLTQVLGYSALILILAEGGLTTSWEEIKPSVAPAALLSTLGVVVSVVVVAVPAHLVLDASWTTALLLGAILASTDAAAVFSVLRRVPLPRRITGLLEAEAGFNDAPVVILVVALAEQAARSSGSTGWWELVLMAVRELAVGAAIGLLVGYAGGHLMRRIASSSSGLFSLGVVSLTVLAYGAGVQLHASGFLAVYLSALVLGNMRLPHRSAVHGFAQALGWLAQIGLFVLLGLQVTPSRLSAQTVGAAIVIGLALLLVARPLSVLVSLTPFKVPWRDQAFLSWAGLRGGVPIVLATVPLTRGTPDADRLFDLVFVLVVIFTLVQAPALPWVARRLGVTDADRALDIEVESTPLDELRAEVLAMSVGATSLLHGVEVFELRLPAGANVTLILRGDEAFVPSPRTTLRHGDQLMIVATAQTRLAAEDRVRQVSKQGRLAGWNPDS